MTKKKSLTGKKIIITAGPTREQIDPVRFISNNSSGKMGYSLARAAVQLGAEVTLISGPTSLTVPDAVKLVPIKTTTDLHQAVKKHINNADCLIMAAAPADFRPKKTVKQKIKKSETLNQIELEPTIDILKDIAQSKGSLPVIVGFALETDNGLANARKKLKEKNLDMIILNQTGKNRAFESDTNEVTIIRAGKKPHQLPLMDKLTLSSKILDIIAPLL